MFPGKPDQGSSGKDAVLLTRGLFARFIFFSPPCCHDCGNHAEGAGTLLSGHEGLDLLLKAEGKKPP